VRLSRVAGTLQQFSLSLMKCSQLASDSSYLFHADGGAREYARECVQVMHLFPRRWRTRQRSNLTGSFEVPCVAGPPPSTRSSWRSSDVLCFGADGCSQLAPLSTNASMHKGGVPSSRCQQR